MSLEKCIFAYLEGSKLCLKKCAVYAENKKIRIKWTGHPYRLIIYLYGIHVNVVKMKPTQQAQDICITRIQRLPNVVDVGPILYKCYTNVLRLLWIYTMYSGVAIKWGCGAIQRVFRCTILVTWPNQASLERRLHEDEDESMCNNSTVQSLGGSNCLLKN